MGGIIGGIVGGIGQAAAAKAQANAAKEAARLSLTGFNYLTQGPGAEATRSFIDSGTGASEMRAALLGIPVSNAATTAARNGLNNYLNSSAFQFQLGQGLDAINANAATKGLLNSGGTLKATQEYGTNLARTAFDNYLAQLGEVSLAGQNTLGQIGSVGSTAGGGAANAVLQGGNARAGGIVGLTSSIGNALAGFGGFGGGGGQNYFPPAPTPGVGLY